VSSPFSPHGDRTLYDLAHASLAAPATELRTAAALAVEDLDAHLSGHGYDLLGLPALRAAIARRFTARGLPTTADQVLVTAGGQAAIPGGSCVQLPAPRRLCRIPASRSTS
jgi:DNA-binding transcriptional MocR family regulator